MRLVNTTSQLFEQLAGSVDESHWSQSYGPEVIAIGFGAGAGAINAWYHETNMDGAPGHYNWLMKATTTRVGFGYDHIRTQHASWLPS